MNWMEKTKVETAGQINIVNLQITVQAELVEHTEEELEYLQWVSECAEQAVSAAEDDLVRQRASLKALQLRRQRLVVAAKQAGWTDIIS